MLIGVVVKIRIMLEWLSYGSHWIFVRGMKTKLIMRQSIPRQIDKKSGEERGVWNSQGGGKDKHLFFFSAFLSLSHIKHFFFFFKAMITQQTTQLKFCPESEVAQSCPTLCDPMDCNLPDLSVHGIFQARVLEWVAISFSRESSWPRDRTQVSCILGRCFTLWGTREAPVLRII